MMKRIDHKEGDTWTTPAIISFGTVENHRGLDGWYIQLRSPFVRVGMYYDTNTFQPYIGAYRTCRIWRFGRKTGKSFKAVAKYPIVPVPLEATKPNYKLSDPAK